VCVWVCLCVGGFVLVCNSLVQDWGESVCVWDGGCGCCVVVSRGN
jgi:hypothetical protein